MSADPFRDAIPSEEMAGVMRRLEREDAGLPDIMTLDATGARALSERTNERWNEELPPMEEVRSFEVPAEGDLGTPELKARLYRPAGARGLILYLHGGGWATCSMRTHERCMRMLATEAGATVVGVDYRLAPEHAFPAPLKDCVAAWRCIRRMPAAAAKGAWTAVAGDSAGANLALGLMLHEQAQGRSTPDAGLLFYGVYTDDASSEAHRRLGDGRFGLSTAKMNRYWDWYAPRGEDRASPLAAPLKASDAELAALPPLYLNAAGLDPLFGDTLALARRLDALGRNDRLVVQEGVIHGFMQMTIALQEARAAIRAAADFCRSTFTETTRG